MNALIVYFSRKGENYFNGNIKACSVGNTETMAKMIQNYTKAEMFEVEPVHPYPYHYQECTQLALEELQSNARPGILDYVHDIEQYDVIYLGFPNWWDTMPMVVFQFLESHKMDEKVIVPFCTHEGSGFGKSIQDIQKLCPNATIETGLAIRGGEVSQSEMKIQTWLHNLEVNK